METLPVLKNNQAISLFPSESEWRMLKEQATMLVTTGFLPDAIRKPEQAIAIALKGRELGIPPMQSFAHIHIIQGKPTISSELMLALIFKNVPGSVVNYVQTSDESCVIEARRPGGSAARFQFTMDDAKRAKLLEKGNWKTYPGAMLRARAIAIMARALFPDAIMGCSYTPEELGAEVNDEGEIISIPKENGKADVPPQLPPPAETQKTPEQPPQDFKVNQDQIDVLFRVAAERGWQKGEVGRFARARLGVQTSADLSLDQYDYLMATIETQTYQQACAGGAQ